jgi:hypothetical protein
VERARQAIALVRIGLGDAAVAGPPRASHGQVAAQPAQERTCNHPITRR